MKKVSFGTALSPSKESMAIAVIEAVMEDAGGKSVSEIRMSKDDFEKFKKAFYPDFIETETTLLPKPTMIFSSIIYMDSL